MIICCPFLQNCCKCYWRVSYDLNTEPPLSRYIYYGTTGLFALAMIGAGFSDVTAQPAVMEGIAHLGYPTFLATILGVWKLLGAAAILAPGLPRLKEWAYAGFFFNLTGAAASHAFAGDPAANILTPLVLLSIGLGSWATRPDNRRLSGPLV